MENKKVDDEFVSKPHPDGATERDWTDPDAVLELDMINELGEVFHFEIDKNSKDPRGSSSTSFEGNIPLNIQNVFWPEPPTALMTGFQHAQKRRLLLEQKKKKGVQ